MNERTITVSEIRRVIAELRAVGFDEHYVCGDRTFGRTAYQTALLDVEIALWEERTMADDYISREALPEKRERGLAFFPDEDFNSGWNACLNAIASIPAADVAEVRHGHWIIEGKYTGYRTERCSACGFVANRTYIQDRWFYCPNCGARMDESEDDNG